MSYYHRGSRPSGPRGGYSRGSRGGGYLWPPRRYETDYVRHEDFGPANIMECRYPENYCGDAPIMMKPKAIGSYSIDSNRDFCNDHSMLHFIDQQYLPENGEMRVNLDLKKGCKKFNRFTGNTQESFHNLLRWIENNQASLLDSSAKRLTADFVSLRGSFTKVMMTPYNLRDGWKMYATEFNGSVYLMKHEDGIINKNRLLQDKIRIWGHTFEHCMKGGDPKEVLDANEEFRCVLTTSIAENSLLYAPEVDCVDPDQYEEDFQDLDAFVLVKCCKELTDEWKVRNHRRYKLNQVWVENQLSGVPRTLIGFRNDGGIVNTIQMLKTDELPEMCGGEWDPNVCFNFLEQFLAFVKEWVKTDPGVVFKFDKSQNYVHCSKLSGSEHINLLPDWYTNGMFAADSSDEKSEKSVGKSDKPGQNSDKGDGKPYKSGAKSDKPEAKSDKSEAKSGKSEAKSDKTGKKSDNPGKRFDEADEKSQ